MNPISMLVAVMSGAVLLAGAWHLLIYFRGVHDREYLFFGLTALGSAVYGIMAAGSYTLSSPTWINDWQRGQHLALTLREPALLWFVAWYTRHHYRRLLWTFTGIWLTLFVMELVLPGHWVLLPDPFTKHIELPWGMDVTYHEVRHGPVARVVMAVGLLEIAVLVWMTIRYLRGVAADARLRANLLAAGLGLYLLSVINDMLVSQGAYEFLYLSEFAFVILIMTTGYPLVLAVVHAARMRQELRDSYQRLSRIFNSVHDVYFEVALDGRIMEMSPAVENVLGYTPDQIVGKTAVDICSDAAARDGATAQVLRDGYLRDVELPLDRPDGRTVVCAVTATVVTDEDTGRRYIAGSLRDVTRQKEAEAEQARLQEEVRHAQKLESLGCMAGGIAHDFNNLLVGILGATDLALQAQGNGGADHLRVVRSSAQQARDLCRELLAYAGRETVVPRPLDLRRLVREMRTLLQMSVTGNARLVIDMSPDVPAVEADATMLRQVLMNLVLNAAESLPEGKGVVTVRLNRRRLGRDELSALNLDGPQSGDDFAVLQVEDNGQGMSLEQRERMFDPFYSTKAQGRGLGLSVVQGIVRTHKGCVEVAPAAEQGTVFSILLPATDKIPRETPSASALELEGDHYGGSVLIVDDEAVNRQIAEAMFGRLGFEVTVAWDGHEALKQLAAAPERYNLLVFDLVMPGPEIQQLLDESRRLCPEAPIIICSGYSETQVGPLLTNGAVEAYLPKPYKLAEVRRAVIQAFNQHLAVR